MSGDADTGNSEFTANNSTITTNNGDTFYITNTESTIKLTNNTIVNNDEYGNFLIISGTVLLPNISQYTIWYIRQALQTIDFELNNYGGSVKSEALIETLKEAISNKGREFVFNDDFILYLKEQDKEKPYFALKVDNLDILEKIY